jgi:membrane protease YdiL (CAAX protease family)
MADRQPPSGTTVDASTSSPSPTRQQAATELGVFLFLIVPSLAISLFVTQQLSVGFVLLAISTILRDLALVSLVLYFLWRNGEPRWKIGWTWRQFWQNVALGVVLFVPFLVVVTLLELAFRALGLSAPPANLPSYLSPSGGLQLALGAVLVIVVAVAEETIFRGYLILRFGQLTNNVIVAVLVSAFIFSLGHGYEGSAGVATVGLVGVALGFLYVWRGSLVAPMVMHFLLDFIGIVLAPLLGLR